MSTIVNNNTKMEQKQQQQQQPPQQQQNDKLSNSIHDNNYDNEMTATMIDDKQKQQQNLINNDNNSIKLINDTINQQQQQQIKVTKCDNNYNDDNNSNDQNQLMKKRRKKDLKSKSSKDLLIHHHHHHHHKHSKHRHHHHRHHTVVQKTEKFIIETRKLSVVESTVQCMTSSSSSSSSSLSRHHKKHRKNKHKHHHKSRESSSSSSSSSKTKTNVSTTTTTKINTSSNDLKCHYKSISNESNNDNDNSNLHVDGENDSGEQQQQQQQQQQIQSLKLSSSAKSLLKKSHKKKNSSQPNEIQMKNDNQQQESSGFFDQFSNNCDSSSLSSSKHSNKSRSRSSSTSSSSSSSCSPLSHTSSYSISSSSSCDSDDSDGESIKLNAIKKPENIKVKLKKAKKKLNKSSLESSNSCLDDESQSSCQTTKSNIEDVLTKISVSESLLDTTKKQQSSSTIFSVDTILQQQQLNEHQHEASTTTTAKSESSSYHQFHQSTIQQSETSSTTTTSTTNTQKLIEINNTNCESTSSPLSTSNPNTPDCVINSSMKIDSTTSTSSSTTAATSTMVKKRDPAEERQRLRSYRIAHHQQSLQNRSLSSNPITAATTKCTNVSTTISTMTTSTVSSSTSINFAAKQQSSSTTNNNTTISKTINNSNKTLMMAADSTSNELSSSTSSSSSSSSSSSTITTKINSKQKDQIQRTVVNKVVQQQQQQQQKQIIHQQQKNVSNSLSSSSSSSTTTSLTKSSKSITNQQQQNILSSSITSATTASLNCNHNNNVNKFVQVTSQTPTQPLITANNFLNPSSFFVPTSTFSTTNGFPTFNPFMPTIFNQQLSLNNLQLSNNNISKALGNQLITTAAANRSNPFFPIVNNNNSANTNNNPQQQQQQSQQLTIFTSPPLSTGASAGTAAALSPFSFPGAMQHPTFIPTAAQFSPSSSATSTAPLLMPKSALNFPSAANLTFPGTDPASAAAAAAHSLMMFGLAKSTSNTVPLPSSSSSSTTTTTTTPQFILPRIVQTTTSSTNNLAANIVNTTKNMLQSNTNNSRSNKDKINSNAMTNITSSTLQDVTRTNFGATGPAAITILPNNATSTNTHVNPVAQNSHTAATINQQHSPLSTIISPQTLLLLQSPLSTATATTSLGTKQIANYVSSSAPLMNSTKSLTPIKPAIAPTTVATSTINVIGGTTAKNALISTAPTISTTTTAAINKATIKPLSTNPSSVILAPNSTIQPQLPYTFFSQPSQALMQPISIQAPQTPAPSSMFGAPLLLSVISPTGNRNVPTTNATLSQQSTTATSLNRANLPSPVIITNAPLPTLTATTSSTTMVKNTDTKTSIKSRQSNELKNIQPKIEKTPTTTATTTATKAVQIPVKNVESKKSSANKCNSSVSSTAKINKDSTNSSLNISQLQPPPPPQPPQATISTNVNANATRSQPKSLNESINVIKQQQQPQIDILSNIKSPQPDEFESLVRSVKDTIDAFNATSSGLSDVDDNEVNNQQQLKSKKQLKELPNLTPKIIDDKMSNEKPIVNSIETIVQPLKNFSKEKSSSIPVIQPTILPSKSNNDNDDHKSKELDTKKSITTSSNVGGGTMTISKSSKKKKHRKEKFHRSSEYSNYGINCKSKHKSKQNKKRCSSSSMNDHHHHHKKSIISCLNNGKISSSQSTSSSLSSSTSLINDPIIMNKIDKIIHFMNINLHITPNGPSIDKNMIPLIFRRRKLSGSNTSTSAGAITKISKTNRLLFGQSLQKRLQQQQQQASTSNRLINLDFDKEILLDCKNPNDNQRILPLKKRQHRSDEHQSSSNNQSSMSSTLDSSNKQTKSKSKKPQGNSTSINSNESNESSSTTSSSNKSFKSVGCGGLNSIFFPISSSSSSSASSIISNKNLSAENFSSSNVNTNIATNVKKSNKQSSSSSSIQQQSKLLQSNEKSSTSTNGTTATVAIGTSISGNRGCSKSGSIINNTTSTATMTSNLNINSNNIALLSNKRQTASTAAAAATTTTTTATITTTVKSTTILSSSSSTEQKTAESVVITVDDDDDDDNVVCLNRQQNKTGRNNSLNNNSNNNKKNSIIKNRIKQIKSNQNSTAICHRDNLSLSITDKEQQSVSSSNTNCWKNVIENLSLNEKLDEVDDDDADDEFDTDTDDSDDEDVIFDDHTIDNNNENKLNRQIIMKNNVDYVGGNKKKKKKKFSVELKNGEKLLVKNDDKLNNNNNKSITTLTKSNDKDLNNSSDDHKIQMTNNNNNENKLKLRSSKCSMEIENTQKQQLIDSAMAKNDAQKQINKKNSSITSNGSLKIVADSNSNNVSVNKTKKKRRRIVNKTGFTKPRKRNKKLPNKIPVISKIVENNDNDDNDDCNRKNEQELMPSKSSENEKFNEKIPNIGSKIKVKKKKKKKLKDASSSSSATTASCCSSSECETIDKLKEKKKKKKKISRKSYFDSDSASTTTTSKYSSSIMTESTTATTTTSTESQEDDPDYPIYMVTAPSNKNLNRHKKVYPIKSNPFIRPIPSKKYYQTGLYSDEFMEMYSECAQSDNKSNKNKSNNDDSLVKDENSAKTSVESNELSNKLPILPFPPMCLSSSTTENEEKIDSEKKSSKLKRLDAIRRKYLPKNMDFNQDFQLSFDIWYQYKYNPFPLLMSSANYRRVRQNVFVDVKPIAADSHQACNCTMPRTPNEMACGADCINRMMYQECWPQTCPAKDRCSNQRIQKHQWSPGLERFMTRHRGWGIRTTEKIRKSEFILEYIGEIVSDRLFLKRMNERYNNDQHHYCLKIEPGVVIDGYRVGNEGRFVNHSCEPNCEMQKWAVNGYYRICMFALRDIEPMEELFYDYNFHNFNVETKQICHCGSSKCRGFINGKNSNISTKMTNGMMIANNNDNNMDINHNDLNQFSNHSSIIDDHQHSNKIIVEFPYAFLKSYACLPPNDPLGRNFVYMHKKSRKIKVPINFIKNIYNYTKKYDQQQLQSQKENLVQIFYDPKMLKKKMEPLSYTKKQKILKDSLFMLRNFEKKRKYYLSLQNFLDNQQTENNIYNHHRIRYQSSDLTNGSDSESSTTANRLLTSNCSIKTRGISRVDNDPNSKFIKLLQIYTNICEEIGLFIYKKLHSLLSSDDNESKINNILNKNLTNGFMTDDDSDDYKTDNNKVNNHGAVKRKRKTNDKSHCANNFNEKLNGYELIDNNLMNFTSLLEQIRMNGKLLSLDLFEKSMILHLKKQFDDIRFDVKNGDHLKLKKLKLNGFKDEEYCKTEDSAKNIGLNEINLIEAETYRLLSNKLEQKYAIIENILHSKTINNVKKKELINDSITMINKVKNEIEDNHEKLNETNQAKLNSFIELLQSNEPIPLSDHFSLTRIVESSLPKKKEKLEMNQNKIDDNQLSNIKGKNPEDIIRCICGILREEGQMIQCDKCEIWQHFDCVQQFSEVNLNEHEYVCEVCQPRFIPKDIPLPNNPPNFEMPFSLKFYLTLESPIEKGLRIRLGDCVYIYRQSPNPITSKQLSGKKNSDIKQIDSEHFIETIRTAANNAIRTRSTPFERKQCIIIRVQHLAIIEKTGQKILFGHHYIWPSETYHEPTRKFYPNELLRSPLCEWAAMEEVRKTCMILDPNTYQKGRPIGYDPEDIFICEMRVDRGAKSFSRIPKSAHFPINTKSYAFEYYTEKIKIKRTYSPHELPEPPKKTKSKDRKDNKTDQVLLDNQDDSTVSSMTTTIIKVPEMDEKVKKSKMLRLWQLSNRLIENAYCHQLLKEQQNKMEED